jgi:hypothetical protein
MTRLCVSIFALFTGVRASSPAPCTPGTMDGVLAPWLCDLTIGPLPTIPVTEIPGTEVDVEELTCRQLSIGAISTRAPRATSSLPSLVIEMELAHLTCEGKLHGVRPLPLPRVDFGLTIGSPNHAKVNTTLELIMVRAARTCLPPAPRVT